MNVTYSTTKPRRSDTIAIAKAKWLQVKRDGSGDDSEGQVMVYEDTEGRWHDTKLITLQKILQKENA